MNHAFKLSHTKLHTLETGSKKTPRILLVEDDNTNRSFLYGYLARFGFKVDEAVDGTHAWDLLKQNRDYNLVITDRIMPNMDGMTLFQKIKQHPLLQHLPVIMQTAATMPEEIAEGIQAGVYYYLNKPYEEQTLLALVNSALNLREQALFFQQRLSQHYDVLENFMRGHFRLRTLSEAQDIAFLLGGIYPNPEASVMGLYEILVNAIEHGIAEIGYETKAQLLATGQWENEIQRRLSMPINADKYVDVDFRQKEEQLIITVTDPGPGFDWRPYLQIEPARATKPNGRGIAKVNLLSFDSVTYKGNGNQVELISQRKR